MVLLWRAGGDAEPSSLIFDGTTNVIKFFFAYEQVSMRTASDEEKATQLLCHLEGDAFDLYYDRFARNGQLTEDALIYTKVKVAILEHYKVEEHVEDVIRQAVSASLDYQDIPRSRPVHGPHGLRSGPVLLLAVRC